MSVTNLDKQDRILRIVKLLTAQTRDGTLEWTQGLGGSYKTNLGGQTVVLGQRNFYGAVIGQAANNIPIQVSLEIRNVTGEVAIKVEAPNPLQGALVYGLESIERGYGEEVLSQVADLYRLVHNRKETMAEAALDNVLDALEKRSN